MFGFSAYILKRKIVVLHEYVGKQSCRWPSEFIAFYAQDTDRWKNHDKVPEYGKLPADAEQEVARVEAAGRSEAILCVGLPELPAVTRTFIALGSTARWSLVLYIFGVKSSVPWRRRNILGYRTLDIGLWRHGCLSLASSNLLFVMRLVVIVSSWHFGPRVFEVPAVTCFSTRSSSSDSS